MWRKVLLILVFVGNGLAASRNNQDVFDKLCKIAGNVSALVRKDNGVTSPLKEALYGDTDGESFEGDGTFTGGCSGLSMHLRSQYCSYLPGPLTTNGHGCFGDSLVGTFLCLCTKGGNRERDLCGLNNVGDGESWTHQPSEKQNLFKKVWEEIKNKCMGKNTKDTSGHLGDLERAVNEIKGGGQHKIVKDGYVSLGGNSRDGSCGGTSTNELCVTYKANGNVPHIPWADTILSAIEKLNKNSGQQKASSPKTTQTDSKHHEGDVSTEPDAGDEGDHEEEQGEEEEPAENPSTQNPSKTSHPQKKRRTTNKQRAEKPAEPLKAILHHDDGSFLAQTFWLLSAVFI